LNSHSVIVPKRRRGLCAVFDEPSGVSASNEDTDNFEKDPIYDEILGIKNTAATTTNDPLRKTARNAITKPDPRSVPKTEAEKRRERVTKCRRKKKEKNAEDLLRKEALVADNIRAEGNIARLEQELAQMSQIVAAHQGAQPDVAALLSSFFQ